MAVKRGTDAVAQGHAGFTLVEMVIAMGITLIVGLGAVLILTGTISAQKKLENLVGKGFGTITYRSNGFPLAAPNLLFTVRTGWIRVPSARAIDPNTKALQGSFVTPSITMVVNGSDAIVDKPVWSLCASDDTVRVQCGDFNEGKASITFAQNKPVPPLEAVVRVRAQWPSLPDGHPNKTSPEYVISIPYVRDCDLDLKTPGSPRFLEHGNFYSDPDEPEAPGTCRADWTRYECKNGTLAEIKYKKVCP